MRGRGAAFVLLTGALQFAVGMSTEVAEGAPIAGHDVLAGVLGSLFVVLAIAIATREIGRSLPSIAEALARLLLSPHGVGSAVVSRVCVPAPVARPAFSPFLYNRPPPHIQSILA